MNFEERQFVTVKLQNSDKEQSYIDCTFEIVNDNRVYVMHKDDNGMLGDVVFMAHIDSVEYVFLSWQQFPKYED